MPTPTVRPGFVTVTDFLPTRVPGLGRADCARVAEALDEVSNRISRDGGTDRMDLLDEGGPRSYSVVEHDHLRPYIPQLSESYAAVVDEMKRRGYAARESPYSKSAVTAKRFAPGDKQGWHLDTNPLTALWLTRAPRRTPALIWDDALGTTHSLSASDGDMVLFEGRKVRHCVPEVQPDDVIEMVLFNIYLDDDLWRPEGMDAFALTD